MLECGAFAKGGRGVTVHSDEACTITGLGFGVGLGLGLGLGLG